MLASVNYSLLYNNTRAYIGNARSLAGEEAHTQCRDVLSWQTKNLVDAMQFKMHI